MVLFTPHLLGAASRTPQHIAEGMRTVWASGRLARGCGVGTAGRKEEAVVLAGERTRHPSWRLWQLCTSQLHRK